MTGKRPDVITMLEKEREYHLDQVKRINIALAALTGATTTTEKPAAQKTYNVGWAAAIDALFESTDEWLDLQQIRNKLAENGLPGAIEDKNRNTVYSTLIRKATKTKTLEKSEDGKYRRRQKSEQKEREPKFKRRHPVEGRVIELGDDDKKKGAEGEGPLAP